MTTAIKAKSSQRYRGMAVVIALLALGGAGVWWRYFDTYHFAVVREGVLYRDGVRSQRELETAWRKSQFRTVVSLVSDGEMALREFKDESQMCHDRGIELIRIPVALGGQPSDGDMEKFLAIAQDDRRWPVLVHCAQGVQRTGMMVAAYQQRVLGYDKQKAMDSVLSFGKGKERVDAVKAFIERLYGSSQKSVVRSQ